MTKVLDASDCPGGLAEHEWTSMESCINLFVQALAGVNRTGTVLRLPAPDDEPREMTCDFSTVSSIVSPYLFLSTTTCRAEKSIVEGTVGSSVCQEQDSSGYACSGSKWLEVRDYSAGV